MVEESDRIIQGLNRIFKESETIVSEKIEFKNRRGYIKDGKQRQQG